MDGGADDDVEVTVSVEGEIADGARVELAAARFQFVDDFHGPLLRCPRTSNRRERALQGIDGSLVRPKNAGDAGELGGKTEASSTENKVGTVTPPGWQILRRSFRSRSTIIKSSPAWSF